MPKLSRTRIINLNYNDGKRTIYNEIFDYGQGKNTLFSMDNGIGKTVLIQFFMQPFIRNKRELSSRKFEDYFTAGSPTYILHEIILENGEKLLIGMAVKKENSDDEKNKLRILTFINKYSKPNDFDIINIPFVQGKRIIKFSEAEEAVKNYSRGRLNFKYFNFNDSSKKRDYFNELRLYKIDYKEWEEIIRTINNDESGLSNLYDKHKTSEALIKNVMIPLIESKINGEKNAEEAIKNNLAKYIETYKESKEDFYEAALLKNFKEEMAPVFEFLNEGILKEKDREEYFKKLSFISLNSEEIINEKIKEKLQMEDLNIDLKNELTKVYYEKNSLIYYELKDKENKYAENISELNQQYEEKDRACKNLIKEKYIQECAEIYEDLISDEEELSKVQERILNQTREDSEIAQNIKNYKFTLNKLYKDRSEVLKDKEKNYIEIQEEIENNIKINQDKKDKISTEILDGIHQQEKLNFLINDYYKKEKEYIRKYENFNIRRNPILNEFNKKELDEYGEKLNKNLNYNSQLINSLNIEKEDITNRIKDLKERGKENRKSMEDIRLLLADKKRDLSIFIKETEEINKILIIKSLPVNAALYKEKLKGKIAAENISYQQKKASEEDKLREINDRIFRYETGLIELQKEVLESFENKGISFEYGLNFIKNYNGNLEEKEKLIKSNPFFPYGILLSSKDIQLLKNENLDVFTSIPIPIINKNQLGYKLNIEKSCDVIKIENQDFLVSFNNLLINEEERKKLIYELNTKKQKITESIREIQESIQRNLEYSIKINEYPYKGDEGESIHSEISDLENKVNSINELLSQIDSDILSGNEKIEIISRQINKTSQEISGLKINIEDFNKLIKEEENFKRNNLDLNKTKGEISKLKSDEKLINKEYMDLQEVLRDLKADYAELKKDIKTVMDKCDYYKNSETGILLQGDIKNIENKLEACEESLNDDIRKDRKQEKKLIESINKKKDRLLRKAKEGSISSEYKDISFKSDKLEEIRDKIENINKDMGSLKNSLIKCREDIAVIRERIKRAVQDINELGFENAASKDDIKNSDFKERERKIKNDINQNKDIVKEFEDYINKLRNIRQKLTYFNLLPDKILNCTINFNFKDLREAEKSIDELTEKYKELKNQVYALEKNISKCISCLYEKYRDKNRFIKERLFDYLNKERKIASHSDIESLLEVTERKIASIELQLSSLKSEEEIVINEIVRYANQILSELKTIDRKSSIKHLDKTQKLLEINIPEDTEEDSLISYIKEKIAFYGEYKGDYSSMLSDDIGSSELLSKLIGNISRIKIYIKKIEKTGLVKKSWSDALSQNSGGERFVTMFILLSSLMSYMRRRETDIDNREESKILIMDNPFAKTNAEHLLEPMFKIAEKYNIQLVCFSGIGGSAVYSKFDKIYVAKVIEDRFRNKENVTFKAGTEETLELTDFNITKEQISLF